ncbi:MAG: hypothetical protein WC727_07995 [Ignavibacteriaceae bacterium]|jgi:hypothetical protein
MREIPPSGNKNIAGIYYSDKETFIEMIIGQKEGTSQREKPFAIIVC